MLMNRCFSMFQCGGVAVLVVGAIGLGNPIIVANALSYVPQMPQLALVMYLPGVTQGPSIYLTIAGSLAIILSVIGCGGAFRRHKCGIFVVRHASCSVTFLGVHDNESLFVIQLKIHSLKFS